MKGYKVFNSDFACQGFQFSENSEFKMDEKPVICERGFHFCLKAQHCFSYYSFDPNNIVCEVEALGETVDHHDDTKIATNHIKIGRKLSWEEVLVVANDGENNTGHSNSGNSNSGNWNSGNWNSGYRNSGYSNSGNWNSGNWNSGNWNSGYRNSGDSNSGNSNSGYRNSGDSNSGDWNSGYRNSGYRNSGDSNSGNSNSGDSNSGNWNSGYRNSGDCNSGYRNSGAFCTDQNPILFLFNKPAKLTVREWESSKAVELMSLLEPTIFVPSSIMTDEEKQNHPKHETIGGYLKAISLKEAWKNAWNNWDEESRKVFTSLENFDSQMFEEITGIKI